MKRASINNVMKDFTANIWKEGRMYVSQCLELDVVSQGYSEKAALKNLNEAVGLFLTYASKEEIARRIHASGSIKKFHVQLQTA